MVNKVYVDEIQENSCKSKNLTEIYRDMQHIKSYVESLSYQNDVYIKRLKQAYSVSSIKNEDCGIKVYINNVEHDFYIDVGGLFDYEPQTADEYAIQFFEKYWTALNEVYKYAEHEIWKLGYNFEIDDDFIFLVNRHFKIMTSNLKKLPYHFDITWLTRDEFLIPSYRYYKHLCDKITVLDVKIMEMKRTAHKLGDIVGVTE